MFRCLWGLLCIANFGRNDGLWVFCTAFLTDVFLVVYREAELEGGAHVLLTYHRDVPEVSLYQFVRINHADTGACNALVYCIRSAEEVFEHLLLVGCWYANAGIADSQIPVVMSLLEFNTYISFFRGIL